MRILLVEDDEKIASFIEKGLKAAGFTVDHAPDGQTGLQRALVEPYDLAVIDLMLPGLDGISLIHRLRGEKVQIPVIVLSARDAIEDRVKGLHSGADDYLTKPFAFSELLARIQALLRRAAGTSEPAVLTAGDLSVNLLTRQVLRRGVSIDLQPLEFSLLAFLMRHKGRVVSKTMIMEQVWDYNFDPQTNVVEARICRLRDKIDKPFDPKMIQTVRGVGYVLKEPV